MGLTGIANVVVSGSNGSLELFSSWYNFLVTSGSTVAGVKLIACNSGSSSLGFDYPDQTNKIGNNAWACFQFTSSSNPFYMLIHACTGTATVAAPWNHEYPTSTSNFSVSNYTQYGGVGIQFAVSNNSGSSIWNGTSGALGSDIKGAPVWVSASNDISMYVFPRWNSFGGTNETLRQKLLLFCPHSWINGPDTTTGARFHMAIDDDNVAIARDMFGPTNNNLGSYNYLWFGKYNAYKKCTDNIEFNPPAPYAMIYSDYEATRNPTIRYGTSEVYGGTDNNTYICGGIAHPWVSSSVVNLTIDTLTLAFNSAFNPIGGVTPNTFLQYPIQLYAYETPIIKIKDNPMAAMLLGETKFLQFAYNLIVGDQLSSSLNPNRIVLGSYPTTVATSKYTFPWSNNVNASEILSGGLAVGSRTGSYY